MTVPAAQTADTVAHVDPVRAAFTVDRTVMDSECDSIAPDKVEQLPAAIAYVDVAQ
jgi:hypothetical protein